MKRFIALIVILSTLPVFAGCASQTNKVPLVFACTGYPCDQPATPEEQKAATEEWLEGQKPEDATNGTAIAAVVVSVVAVVGAVAAVAIATSNNDGDDSEAVDTTVRCTASNPCPSQ